MSDAWFNTADERTALEEAEKVGAIIDQIGPRWRLYPLVGVADPMWFEDLDALRAEVKARLTRQQAEAGTPAPVKPPPEEPPPAEHMFSEEQAEFETADDEDDTPHPTSHRRRRRR